MINLNSIKRAIANYVHNRECGMHITLLGIFKKFWGASASAMTKTLAALGGWFGMFGGIVALALSSGFFKWILRKIVPKSWLDLPISYA